MKRGTLGRAQWVALAALLALIVPAVLAASPLPGEAGQDEEVHRLKKVHEDRHVMVLEGKEGEHAFLRSIPFGRGFLGVELTSLTPELRAHFGAPEDAGVMVGRVSEGSPAAEAGIQVGDIITAIDGEKVENALGLAMEVRRREAGEAATVQLVRGGRSLDFEVTIRERERDEVDLGRAFLWRGEDGEPMTFRWRGLEDLPRHFEVKPEMLEGMRESLEAVDWGDVAARMTARRGDVEKRIQELEKRLAELEKALEEATQQKR